MRIITGLYKGRHFDIPRSFKARPTTDFAKENIFNVMNGYVCFDEALSLDLFAGTGSISLELLSRGSKEVISIEADRDHAAFIRQCVAKIGAENHTLIRGDVFRFIKTCRQKFDIIFADPPYALPELPTIPRKNFPIKAINSSILAVCCRGATDLFYVVFSLLCSYLLFALSRSFSLLVVSIFPRCSVLSLRSEAHLRSASLLRCQPLKVVLLAPTGRAAKVLSVNAGMPAFTIHRKIYRQKTFEGDFNLNDNLHTDTLFVADEASMIANEGLTQSVFGSGRLLDDLVQYVYNGKGCRLMLIGDTAQLPPVGEEESPALSTAFMQGYGLRVFESDLREVLRQSQQSGILYNATVIRQMITHDEMTQLPRIVFNRFTDIQVVRGDELIEQLATSYSEVGQDETMVVTRSNKRANLCRQIRHCEYREGGTPERTDAR